MKSFEFETRIPKYFFPLLIEYSVAAGKPVLESITYDELPISILDLTPAVSGWINDAAVNNYATVKKDEFDRQFALLSNTNSIIGLGAKQVIAAGGASDAKAAEVIADLKKQIKGNRHWVIKMIGSSLVKYFETAEL